MTTRQLSKGQSELLRLFIKRQGRIEWFHVFRFAHHRTVNSLTERGAIHLTASRKGVRYYLTPLGEQLAKDNGLQP